MSSRVRELAKFLVYRTPIANRLMAPGYRYKVDPAALAAMVRLIDATRDIGGAVLEIGVAQGDSSVFLLEHLKSCGDPRPLLLFDTFSGFTPQSIAHEVGRRGKPRSGLNRFRYTDRDIFRRNIERAGYTNFRLFEGDASKFDWEEIGPVAAVLLDIDLYLPTRDVLAAIWPRIVPAGGIVVDDCIDGTEDDGAMQAYQEFLSAHGLPFRRLGAKGGLVTKERPAEGTGCAATAPARPRTFQAVSS